MSVAHTAIQEVVKGSFQRTESSFRNTVVKGSRFEPEVGRYHLYISLACPWACRCLAVLNMKGLQGIIGVSIVHQTWQRTRPDVDQHCGWVFSPENGPALSSSTGHGSFTCEGCIPDPLNEAKSVRDLYELAGDTQGKYSVPILWCSKLRTIVNNESSEIIRMLNSEFNDFASNPDLDLYPVEMRDAIDEVNSWVYPSINNGVYRCGFSTTQQAYNEAYMELFAALDRCEDILSRQPFIAGDMLTEADVRLFVTLIRHDHVYVVYFKCDKKSIREYPLLKEYVKKVYRTPGIKETVNMKHIKEHYFSSHPHLNEYAVVPIGGDHWWE